MSGSRVKIVAIVDDDRNLRVALQDLLGTAGLRGELYASAEEFLSRKSHLAVDCIVSDLRLPGMSGIDLLRRLRREGMQHPVIIMTSYPGTDTDAIALREGALAFLSKPLNSEELLNLICADK